jgi:hypothetical protein
MREYEPCRSHNGLMIWNERGCAILIPRSSIYLKQQFTSTANSRLQSGGEALFACGSSSHTNPTRSKCISREKGTTTSKISLKLYSLCNVSLLISRLRTASCHVLRAEV